MDSAGIERGAAFLDKAAASTKAARPPFPRVWLDDAAPELGSSYLVKGLIDRCALTVIYGPSGDGKTFFTADLSGHIASARAWRGRRVNPALVVYVAAEAGASILRRFCAWRDKHLSDAREGRIPLAVITRGSNLLDAAAVEALLAELRTIAVEIGLPLGLVVFDTLSRSMPGGDENRSEDMTRVIEAADAIRDDLGAGVVLVHHSGKDIKQGARGHSSLFAAADCVIQVVERVATVEKSRDGTSGERFAFDLEVVDLGTDADGDPVTTCVVNPIDGTPPTSRAKELPGMAKIALQALQEAIADHGAIMPSTSTLPSGVRAVTLQQWRTRFEIRYGGDGDEQRDPETIRKAFQRAREALLKGKAVGIAKPYAWLWQ